MKRTTVEVDGEEWELNDKPKMGTVRYVQKMQMQMFQDNLSDEQIKELVEESDGEELNESDLMEKMIQDKGMDSMADLMWDQSIMGPLQAICLATDRKLTNEDVDKMPAPDFMELRDKSNKILGGNAKDFLDELGIDTSSMLNENEVQEEADLPTA